MSNYDDLPIHPMQAMIDAENAKNSAARSKTQMTLGKLIALLQMIEPARPIKGFGELMSYRGYYCDLAFESRDGTEPAANLLARCEVAMGRVFEGYKGGDYAMHENTPLWIAHYGTTGVRLMDLDQEKDPVEAITEHED